MDISRKVEHKKGGGFLYWKVVKTNHVTEIYGYERININGGGKTDGDGEYSEDNYRQTQKARRDKIRRLITQNFDLKDKFLTLTFAENMTDVKQANKLFELFVKRVRYRYPKFQYVAVIEFQKRGAVHYHMVCNLPYVPNKQLSDLWRHGHLKVNKITHVDNIGAYVTKYMNKNLDDERLKGLNAYNRSKGLKEPEVYRDWKAHEVLQADEIRKLLKKDSVSYYDEYETEKAGKIVYIQFNTKRKNNQPLDIVTPPTK